jgi:uncharacterized damage-inducible protein DinB
LITNIETPIIETWRINNRVNLFMIENIPEEALAATLSTRGGRDIARQFAHMHIVRVKRLTAFAKKSALELIQFDKNESPSRKILLLAFEQSGTAMERFMTHCVNQGGAVSNFKRGLVPMLGYYISHEAHHRGNILVTMKQNGIKVPDTLRWGIWEWNRI